MPEPTHILLKYPSQDTERLFRAADGIMIAEIQNCTILFGAAPHKKTTRVFIDYAAAQRFIRFVADLDASGIYPLPEYEDKLNIMLGERPSKAAVLDERDEDGLIVLPPGSLELATNGAGAGSRIGKAKLKAN